MNTQPVLDIFEERPEAVVPRCAHCGAQGPRIEVGGVVPSLRAAALWAVIEIERHEREMHPEVTRERA